jgi:hypothetical protein
MQQFPHQKLKQRYFIVNIFFSLLYEQLLLHILPHRIRAHNLTVTPLTITIAKSLIAQWTILKTNVTLAINCHIYVLRHISRDP